MFKKFDNMWYNLVQLKTGNPNHKKIKIGVCLKKLLGTNWEQKNTNVCQAANVCKSLEKAAQVPKIDGFKRLKNIK